MCMRACIGGWLYVWWGRQQGITVVEGTHSFRKEGTLSWWEGFRTQVQLIIKHLLCLPWWLSGSVVKNLPVQETRVWSLSQEDALEKEMGLTPVFLPGKSHGQRSLAGYGPDGYKRVRHDLATKLQQMS